MQKLNQFLEHLRSKLQTAFPEGKIMDLLDLEVAGKQGDVIITVFKLAKHLKKPITEVTTIISGLLDDPVIEKSEIKGGYINIFLKPIILKNSFLELALTDNKKAFTRSSFGKDLPSESIMIEYLSPNTNKPLHLGHVRNGVTGKALASLAHNVGQRVIKAEMVNDRGIHICKSLLAWRLWGNNQSPEDLSMKGDHFVGKWYVEFHNRLSEDPTLEAQAQEMLRLWEAGDPKTIADWELMNSWFMSGFRQTCRDYGFDFDAEFFESKTYKFGKQVVEDGLERGIFRKDAAGRIVIDLPADEFGLNEDQTPKVLTLLREDGTGVYITQDLGTAKIKFDEYQIDQSWYVVAAEQTFYFKCLFYVLSMLKLGFREKMKHCSYGMVYLPEGRMKSREGTVVDADDLLVGIESAIKELSEDSAKKSIQSVFDKDLRQVALAAIKFYLLRVHPDNDIYFNPQESVSLDGYTGTYCQYTFARINSVLLKAGHDSEKLSISHLFLDEWLDENYHQLVLMTLKYPEIISSSYETLNPSLICRFVFDLCQKLNQIYELHPVISELDMSKRQEKLVIFACGARIIQHALSLLDIQTVTNM
jgi:arginyl-tRNA synthetase